MVTRICNTCNLEKELNFDNFSFNGSNNKNYRKCCRSCYLVKAKEQYPQKRNQKINNQKQLYLKNKKKKLKYQKKYHQNKKNDVVYKEYFKQYAIKNKEKLKEYRHQRYLEKKEEIKAKRKEYILKNKEKIKIKNHNNYLKNKKIISEKGKLYYIKNKDKILIRQYNYEKKQRQFNIKFKIKKTISAAIRYHLSKNSLIKNISISKYLPYSIQDLKLHIEKQFEPWMTWNNWGKYNSQMWNDQDQSTWNWQIDHIIPHSTFQYTSMKDELFQQCWSLNNLRPYSAKQNFIDGVHRIRHDGKK